MLRAKRTIRTLLYSAVLICTALAAGELAARLDDWWFQKIGFWSTPSYNDLFIVDDAGQRRGKPNARYQKWEMNLFGFRGPAILRRPPPGTRRVILLGASETFGLYEPPNKEFAAQLADLTRQDNFEIVNAALPGITLATLDQYWRTWVSGFSASTIIIYPSIHLYLTCENWQSPTGLTESAPQDLHAFTIEDLRLFGRIKNVVSQPESIVEWRNARKVTQSVSQHPRTWLYTTPPRTCLARLQSDLLRLIDDIQRSGANVIVCTQALRASRVPGPADLRDLESFRVFSPQVPARVAREFVSMANNSILKLPELRDVRVVDVDSALGGQRWAFEDLVHFNEHGSRAVAALLRDSLVSHADSMQASQK